MKKFLITIIFTAFGFLSFSQDYPIIETDSSGKKVVVMTYEQAQKIDNAFEMLELLEKAGVECDSLNLSYIKVIDVLNKQVSLLEIDLNLYKNQIIDKDKQINNLKERLANCESSSATCNQQISVRDDQITLLKEEIRVLKTKRNIAYGVGIVGIIGGILIALSVK